jgi:RNA polymerase sigma factor (sigma-70 family)
MTMATEDFASLVKRVRQGDDAAMGKLIERYGAGMQRLAQQLIGRQLRAHLDALDLVQTVQITLWMGIRSGRFMVPTPESLFALVKTLLRFQVARHWRAAKNEMTATVESNLNATVVDERLLSAPKEKDPHERMEFDELLEQFLGQLDDVDQRLVRLRFQGCTTAEAAKYLQVDPGYLRVRLGRLRKKFVGFWPEDEIPAAIPDSYRTFS